MFCLGLKCFLSLHILQWLVNSEGDSWLIIWVSAVMSSNASQSQHLGLNDEKLKPKCFKMKHRAYFKTLQRCMSAFTSQTPPIRPQMITLDLMENI